MPLLIKVFTALHFKFIGENQGLVANVITLKTQCTALKLSVNGMWQLTGLNKQSCHFFTL